VLRVPEREGVQVEVLVGSLSEMERGEEGRPLQAQPMDQTQESPEEQTEEVLQEQQVVIYLPVATTDLLWGT